MTLLAMRLRAFVRCLSDWLFIASGEAVRIVLNAVLWIERKWK